MHATLHLTTGCNMRCGYCYSPPEKRIDMSEDTMSQAIKFIAENFPSNPGLIFFGGEPLLKKELINNSIKGCQAAESKYGIKFHYKVTTNGLLLDREFLEFAKSTGLMVSLSIDGIKDAHDLHRKFSTGDGTFDAILPKLDLLLKYQPYANALITISTETIQYYADSVDFLFQEGFRYIIASLNYAGNWTDKDITLLQKQYRLLSRWYEKLTLSDKKFYFSPFEIKLATHIQGPEALCNRCIFGMEQVSIAPDGKIYPCVQFVQDSVSNTDYSIGDIWNGIDKTKQKSLYELSQSRTPECLQCAFNGRCNNNCSCLNWQTTRIINQVSPVLCQTEKVLIPIVDELGTRLFNKRAPMFIQKHYNSVYPILSLLEDQLN